MSSANIVFVAALLSTLFCGHCNLNTLVGLTGKDFTILGGDTSFFRGMTLMDGSYKKVIQLDHCIAAAASGEQGDVDIFMEWLQRHLSLRRLSGRSLGVSTVSNIVRRDIAASLRKRPQDVSMLLGGWDVSGSKLYWIDNMGALQEIPFGAHGAASSFLLSILDRSFHRNMSLRDALVLMNKCIKQLVMRYAVSSSSFQFMVIDNHGCREIDCESFQFKEGLENS